MEVSARMVDEVAALKELFSLRMDHMEKKLEEHTQTALAHYQEIARQFVRARDDMHHDQQLLAERTTETQQSLSIRLDEMNALRRQIEQERNLYVTRDRMEAGLQAAANEREGQLTAVNGRVDDLASRVNEAEKAKANLDGRFSLLGMVLVGVTILLQAVMTYISRSFK